MKKYGIMLDMSRGRVLTTHKLKEIIKYCKEFGYTYINLYLEDLISLEEYPQFGYMRGRYSDEEIIEIVRYTREIGLDIYPAIQTLGHFEHFLQWKDSSTLADTDRVLNVLKDDTTRFIECLISKCFMLFGGDTINIGMDEAFDLGMGNVFRTTGMINQKQLYFDFQASVINICKKYGYRTIKVWSDMIFSIYSNTGAEGLYSPIDTNSVVALDPSLELIFWNYWSKESAVYHENIKAHKRLTNQVSVALGLHTWGEISYLQEMLEVTKTALVACDNESIDNILFTMWGDDGSLYNLDTAIYGMYLTSTIFNGKKIEEQWFNNLTGINFDSAQRLSTLSSIGINPLALFWNDPITNIYLNSQSLETLNRVSSRVKPLHNSNTDKLAYFYNLTIDIVKLELENYLENNINFDLIDLYKQLLEWYERNWVAEAKYEGLEEIQKRLATKIYRLDYLQKNELNTEICKICKDRSYSEYDIDINYSSLSNAIKSRW